MPDRTVIVDLPFREDAKTQAFRVRQRRWVAKGTTLITITALDQAHRPLQQSRVIVVALDDLPLLLAGIRKALAGPLEALLLEHEEHYRSIGDGDGV